MSKATDIIGGLGSVATSAINAWNGVNPITGISETANNINMLGNTLYASGDLTNLSNQFTAATNIQTNGLLNRLNETFGLLFASGLDGMQAGLQLGGAIDGAISQDVKKANLGNRINKLQNKLGAGNTNNRLERMQAAYDQMAYGGHLHSLGGDIGALVGAVMNPALMAISGSVQDSKLHKFQDLFNALSDLALQRNTLNFSNAITDSTNMMFDNKALQMKAYGGPLGYFWDTFDNGVRVIKEGGTHEENPHQGVQQGIAPDGLPNLVEEGEVIYNDFVYSDRLKLTKEQAQQFKLGGEMSYAQAALKLSKESEERPNDIISKNGLRDSMNKLKVMQEELKATKLQEDAEIASMLQQASQNPDILNVTDPNQTMFAKGGHLFTYDGDLTNPSNISPELQALIDKYRELQSAHPDWTLEQIIKEIFVIDDNAKTTAINTLRQKVIDESVRIAKTRTSPGVALTSTPISDEDYTKRLKESGWTNENEIKEEVARAKLEKAWMTASCAATATDNIYQAMAKYYPQELLTEIQGNDDLHGNIFNQSVLGLRNSTPLPNDVYEAITPNSDFSNLQPGDILTYMTGDTTGHAITFNGYDKTGKPMFSLSWGGIGPNDVGLGTRGFPADSPYTNNNFPLDAEVTNNRGLLNTPDMVHRYVGNQLTNDYVTEDIARQILSDPLVQYLSQQEQASLLFDAFNLRKPSVDNTLLNENLELNESQSESFWDTPKVNMLPSKDIQSKLIPSSVIYLKAAIENPNKYLAWNLDPDNFSWALLDYTITGDPTYLLSEDNIQNLTSNINKLSNSEVVSSTDNNDLHPEVASKSSLKINNNKKVKPEKLSKPKKQKQDILPTNWYDGLKEITDVNDITGDILHINGKRYRLPLINPFDSNYNGQQLHYVEAKPAVKDKDGNVTHAAVPGHWEVTQGNGAQPLPQDPMADMMRMAPVWGSLAQSIQALSAKPNYQHLDAAIRAASQIPYVNYTPIGNYERFDRIDPNTQANALRAQYAQAMRNMLNSGASRAAVNALQTNALQGLAGALGEAAQTGRTYNNTLKEKEIATQLGIDQALLGASLDASNTNQGRASTYAQMVGAMAPAKQAIDDAIETNKYTTQTAVANNLGNVGIDKLNRLMLQWMIERGVYPGVAPIKATGGKLKYKTYRKKK